MDFNIIKAKIKEAGFETLRVDNDTHFEAVFVKKTIGRAVTELEGFLGEAKNITADAVSIEISRIVDACGGIMVGQTLYYAVQGKEVVVAMLWPWSDSLHVTLKLVKAVLKPAAA
ncbi:MAG: hypothetical protein KBA46_03715 [Candidatus Omnitrophica bacterium]|nr:hypothetical protein [Candidatus Omnitrophota bacterium]